ncbi:eukaryotic translation initiation factor 4E isoform X2 [Lepeophtheirus salmonis]|uniref:eIF-4F 25 kDa subunit n=1 Tax=Lepeophtheirus salmonis TaxID=72036 RepID=C1BTM4_LEPSM|nr:eukaryotic translation initiation factor 4E-like [Lepeophtheirus salmonis]ACO12377.1 Eukaryotic translation initiation factor 4E-3 [Lepeophtheirus salmonis]ADD38757.1 Eukaryotic translation initiation factor 4E-3 [Lepeophtheirus salmonis]
MKTSRKQYETRSRKYSAESTSPYSSASVSPADSPTDFEIKHPLEHEWTLWYYNHDPQNAWEDNLKEVISFNTVEDFWAIYNHIELASEISDKCDYCLFKKGVKPMWEDASNCNGGRWVYSTPVNRRKSFDGGLDVNWLEVMMSLIGEAFEGSGDLINGAVVSLRNKSDKISIWLGTAYDEDDGIRRIGAILKKRLGLRRDEQLSFEVHRDNQKRINSTAIRPKYQV